MALDISITTLYANRLPAVKGTLYTVPAGKSVILRTQSYTNLAGASRTINIYINDGSGSRQIIPKDLQLFAGDTLEDDKPVCLKAGDALEGYCNGDAAAVDALITGVVNTL
jgi:hypothetical protein